jgi:hypothetical protein
MITIVLNKAHMSLKYQVRERINTVDSCRLHHKSVCNDEVRAFRIGHGPYSL